MLVSDIKTYRQIFTLKDGVKGLLRSATIDDAEILSSLYENISADDKRFLRENVGDPKVIQGWCEDQDYRQTLPLLALVQDRVVGQATLFIRHGPERHIGEIRIFLAKDFRRRGLGSKMLGTLIDLARKKNLYLLAAKVVANQTKVIKAFQKLGFELRCTLEDYFMLPDGEMLDLVILLLYLRDDIDEF